MGLLKEIEDFIWSLILAVAIAWLVVAYLAIYVLSALAVWAVIRYLMVRHRLQKRFRPPACFPPEFPLEARIGKFTVRRLRRPKAGPRRLLPLDIIIPNGAEIRGIE